MDVDKKDEVMEEIPVVPSDPKPAPPSKAASVHSEDPDEMKYETIQTIKMNEPGANAMTKKTMEKPTSVINSSHNLLPNQAIRQQQAPSIRKGVSVNTKLGIIQLVLSVTLSAFGGLLIARNASLSMIGSGIWSGIFAGIAGALGLMNIKPLLNGFVACSLISVATSTLALALTGIGLVRDYNLSQQDPEFEAAVIAACGLTFLLVLHLLTSIFSVYYSALELCSTKPTYNINEIHAMNYEKVQKYLKSLQNDGVTNYDMNGYQNYINNTKLHRQQRSIASQHMHPHHYHVPIYAAPQSVSSGYLTNSRMYTLPHSYQSNYYQDYYYTQDETPRALERNSEKRKKSVDERDMNLSYTGIDREIADSYLKSIESKDQHI